MHLKKTEHMLRPCMELFHRFLVCFRWRFVIEYVPMWLAPNAITMIGLVINIVTSVILIYYCPTATEPVSNQTVNATSEYQLIFHFPGAAMGDVSLRPRSLHLPDVGRDRRQASAEDRHLQRLGGALRPRLRQCQHR